MRRELDIAEAFTLFILVGMACLTIIGVVALFTQRG